MNTVCPACQAKNRVPEERLNDGAKCGRCNHELFDGAVINASETTFDALISDDVPVVVDFWAPWCGPCQNFAPIFSDVAKERATSVRFVKVDTESAPQLSARFRIRSIPTLMVFKQGKMVEMLSGALPKAQFNAWLDQALQK
ncbi:MAG: thioredoxin TrxC [Plesiomonas sp.]|uniref:thioredoxin TrxC n=1 Tax=Plesiomonas sp. TaxID=2486279 RepID=UPI003F30A7FE